VPTRVGLLEDCEILLQGLRSVFRGHGPGLEAVATPADAPVDVTLFDTQGGKDAGTLRRVGELARDPVNGAVVIFSFSDRADSIESAVLAGARGFVSKAAPALSMVRAMREVASGRRVLVRSQRKLSRFQPSLDGVLSPRLRELLALLPLGLTNRELAARLFVSENTVKTQLRQLFVRLGVKNRVQAANFAREVAPERDA
jgi:DNA-binding NarL/FixJ family response regulator